MLEDNAFADFLRRIRAGDDQAAVELVRQFEPLIRTEVRMRLSDPRRYRLFDSMDICQSVLGSFFIRVAAGEYDLQRPEQLVKLLVAITRNKLAFQIRKAHRQRRDVNRLAGVGVEEMEVASSQATPSQCVAGEELLRTFRSRLTDEERSLAELRAQDASWDEVANCMGGTSQGRRKQLARAVDRVSKELGLD
jgi:DNA-directed RNA polymerase specialized sigma24 family protein